MFSVRKPRGFNHPPIYSDKAAGDDAASRERFADGGAPFRRKAAGRPSLGSMAGTAMMVLLVILLVVVAYAILAGN